MLHPILLVFTLLGGQLMWIFIDELHSNECSAASVCNNGYNQPAAWLRHAWEFLNTDYNFPQPSNTISTQQRTADITINASDSTENPAKLWSKPLFLKDWLSQWQRAGKESEEMFLIMALRTYWNSPGFVPVIKDITVGLKNKRLSLSLACSDRGRSWLNPVTLVWSWLQLLSASN